MKVAVWDFDGTLARRAGGWTGAILEALRGVDSGCTATVDDLRPLLQSGYPWHSPEVTRAAGQEPDAWWQSLAPVLIGAITSVGEIDSQEAGALVKRVREIYVDPTSWTIYDDTLAALDSFARAGWVQFILSNHVPELPAIVDAIGLGGYFQRVWTSAETGAEKPNPRAFDCVLEALPAEATTWMIGDSISMDITGATNVGMNSVLVRKVDPTVKHCCESLEDVLATIEDA